MDGAGYSVCDDNYDRDYGKNNADNDGAMMRTIATTTAMTMTRILMNKTTMVRRIKILIMVLFMRMAMMTTKMTGAMLAMMMVIRRPSSGA